MLDAEQVSWSFCELDTGQVIPGTVSLRDYPAMFLINGQKLSWLDSHTWGFTLTTTQLY